MDTNNNYKQNLSTYQKMIKRTSNLRRDLHLTNVQKSKFTVLCY